MMINNHVIFAYVITLHLVDIIATGRTTIVVKRNTTLNIKV